MTHKRILALAVPLALGLAANVGMADVLKFKEGTAEEIKQMSTGPQATPMVTKTGFAPALRCMDSMYITYGVKNVSMLVEDLRDETKKINAATKDMLISAVSDMTRRSRAVKLIAFSEGDSQNLVGFMSKAQSSSAYATMPDYDIRGSVSQFDDSLVKKQGDAGFNIPWFGMGGAKSASGSILGLDLSVISTKDMSLIPGVTSKNSILVMKEGTGVDGEAMIRKLGLNFNFTVSKSEGQAQALRTLVELAVIELIGKLQKIPYWTCLGASDQDETVAAEILDWWESLAADPRELVLYFQRQMAVRGIYEGEIDGRVNEDLLRAIKIYQQAMGMSESSTLDLDFFRRYLAANHADVQPKAQARYKEILASKPVAQPAPTIDASGPLNVVVQGLNGVNQTFQRGKNYFVEARPQQDMYMYCYVQDETRALQMFHPNPFQTNAFVKGGSVIPFPGKQPFRFVANKKGINEKVVCYGSASELGSQAPKEVAAAQGLTGLNNTFKQLAGPSLGIGSYEINIR
ncbi:MAG: DUF4384 domain-containing protein [Chitinivorax sp.]